MQVKLEIKEEETNICGYTALRTPAAWSWDINKAKKPTHAQITLTRSITYMMQNCWLQNAFPIYVCLGFSKWNNTYFANSIFNNTETKKHLQY